MSTRERQAAKEINPPFFWSNMAWGGERFAAQQADMRWRRQVCAQRLGELVIDVALYPARVARAWFLIWRGFVE